MEVKEENKKESTEKVCKSKNVKVVAISVIVSMILSAIFSVFACTKLIAWANGSNIGLEDFKISSFNLETEKTDYDYIDNYYTYKGKGIISTTDIENDYIVELELINATENNSSYELILIHNGTGNFSTYDYSENLTNAKKPQYMYNVIGFKMLNK